MNSASRSSDRYEELYRKLLANIPEARLIRDDLRRFAYGTDASFYRLTPKLVVRVQSEAEVIIVVRACAEIGVPYTFRAAGTSLSGQAISDSVLIQVSRLWNGIHLNKDGTVARLEPAVLGADANKSLSSFARKIGPDPASIDSAMIGGIAANNASGMCCGNVQDTYHTMASARIVFADGTVLDTGSQESWHRFTAERKDLIVNIEKLSSRVKANSTLSQKIRHKYKIKNTTGYCLNALIDFEDPREIISHLLVGSEGTLGFISEISYNTVADPQYRATSLALFPDMFAACDAAYHLGESPVAVVELMDRKSLGSVQHKPGIPGYFRTLSDGVTALLVEVRAESSAFLQRQTQEVTEVLSACRTYEPITFTEDKLQSKRLWEIRKGLFPSLGRARQSGATIIIEDVAFPAEHLANAAVDLQALFARHGYDDAVIFGHALQCNLHFVFCVNFNDAAEVSRYAAFMEEVTRVVTEKYDGSLKAEHGTGRNMAPFVEREWGTEAFKIMKEIKDIFDPWHLLNPGVILSDNPKIHISDLKSTPVSDPIIEKCTECGFCERTCPSKNLTLTPRQRITVWREISRLTATGEDPNRQRQLRKEFDYEGEQTCAVDGLCGTLCPLDIDTGAFIKKLRGEQHSSIENRLASAVGNNLSRILFSARVLLAASNAAHSVLGTKAMTWLTKVLRKSSMGSIPAWNPWLPKPSSPTTTAITFPTSDKVVYFPACVSRLFGVMPESPYGDSQNTRIQSLLVKAGYTPLYPEGLENLCCGMAFSSKGFTSQGNQKTDELGAALKRASNMGEYPILMDTSPCTQRLREYQNKYPSLRIYDIAEFLLEFVVPRLSIRKRSNRIALHVPCSLLKSAQERSLIQLAKMCAETVSVPESTPCCGFAGDRGFTHPELPASALVTLKVALLPDCKVGYSTSRTCEIGVSQHSGISYQSIAYLLDEASEGLPRQLINGPTSLPD